MLVFIPVQLIQRSHENFPPEAELALHKNGSDVIEPLVSRGFFAGLGR